eukprot:11160357-Lingulodinium_polyedra.AAC.1
MRHARWRRSPPFAPGRILNIIAVTDRPALRIGGPRALGGSGRARAGRLLLGCRPLLGLAL